MYGSKMAFVASLHQPLVLIVVALAAVVSSSCSDYGSCSSCTSQSTCGWCPSMYSCFTGSSSGPYYDYCPGSWKWTSSTCQGGTPPNPDSNLGSPNGAELTSAQCIANAHPQIPVEGWMLFMIITLVLLVLFSAFCMIARQRGWISPKQVNVLLVGSKILATAIYLIAMARNLNVHMKTDPIWFCDAPLDPGCRKMTAPLASNFVKAFLAINFMFYIVAAGVVEFLRANTDDSFEELNRLAWGFNEAG